MEQGIELLKNDSNAQIAFNLMNRAMLKQWQQLDKNKGITKDKEEYQWRPFQLGFILMTLQSTIDENSKYRDVLDLIWFPTGGGKTEAYLGLMAFLFVYRRLKYGDNSGGTAAIMRYTLRLLTTQQFTRATKLVFALDLIRQQDPEKLGAEPFSVGLWVGGATTPNTIKEANEQLGKDTYNKLIITKCPWCDSTFTKEKHNYQNNDGFNFHCTHQDCDFGKNSQPLPCNVIDEMLYKNPPTLLLATVDKFARFPWEKKDLRFFGHKR